MKAEANATTIMTPKTPLGPWIWIPLLVSICGSLGSAILFEARFGPPWLAPVSMSIGLASLLVFSMQLLYRLMRRQWPNAWLSLKVLLMCTLLFAVLHGPRLAMAMLLASWLAPDDFAKDLAIPEGLDVLEPQMSLTLPDGRPKDEPILTLASGHQPGIYCARFCVNPGEPGFTYLKAFEVTQGTRLSSNGLKKESTVHLDSPEDPNDLFSGRTGMFFIKEGDWGDHYAARFELWFVPDSGQPERKLLERVYKIEGWEL